MFSTFFICNLSLAHSLLKVHLQVRGYSVFIDVEKLEAGKFQDKLIQSVQRARNFILVLSANALDKCMGDTAMKDWVHKVRILRSGLHVEIGGFIISSFLF